MTVKTKICGITDPPAMEAAARHGADFCGLVFFPPSPRNVSPEDAAMLTARARPDMEKVGLFVDPDDDLVDRVLARVPLDVLQLHGKESPDRCAILTARTGKKIIKAVHVREAEDLKTAERYKDVARWILFDAKPPKDASRPGGNAETFDWMLLKDLALDQPWMLAGGITPDNAATALRITRAPAIDVSSSVESAPGKKDPAKIAAFLTAVRNA